MDRFGIYVHIPFCKKKCKYCDFISFFGSDEKIDKYFNYLNKEIENSKYKYREVTTIYIGGGTPSLPNPEYISNIINKISENFKISKNAEITVEVNPGTVTKEKIEKYKSSGVNRISIGLQAVQNRLLKLIGRIHTYEEFLESYNIIKNAGIDNINVDLMLALPTQTLEELKDSVNEIIKINPKHISLYSLILEEGTELEKLVDDNKIELIDEKTEREMYWETKKILEKNGYNQYEISNFSKKGFESKHNMDCWNQEEYIGFGLAAHSYVENKRFSNTENFDEYIKNIENNEYEKNIQLHETQDREAKAKEFMMIGLRKIEGISISEFERRFRINPLFYFRFEIEKLVNEDLIEVDLDNIKLASKGLDLANLVFEEFL